jgi:uroporphyrinogen-III synthase
MEMDSPEAGSAQLALLHRISGIVSSDRPLDEVLSELVGLTVSVTACDACLVYLIDPTTREAVLRASQLPHEAELGSLFVGRGEGITGWVAEHNAVVSLPSNASKDSRFKSFPGLVEDTYAAFLSVPLVSHGRVIGVINVHHREEHVHSASEVALLSFVGEQMGGAVEAARLRQENARLQEETILVKQQLEARKVVERAKGILQSRLRLTEEDAYLRLRNESRRQRRSMRELAEEIVREEVQARTQSPS